MITIISFSSFCRVLSRNTFRCATLISGGKVNNLVWASTFFHQHLYRENSFSNKHQTWQHKFCPFWFKLWKICPYLPKDTLQRFIRYDFELSYNSKFLETTTYYNSYSIVSTNSDGFLFIKASVCYANSK